MECGSVGELEGAEERKLGGTGTAGWLDGEEFAKGERTINLSRSMFLFIKEQ